MPSVNASRDDLTGDKPASSKISNLENLLAEHDWYEASVIRRYSIDVCCLTRLCQRLKLLATVQNSYLIDII